VIVLDANVLIAHFEDDHTFAGRAEAILESDDDLLIHPLTLAECLVGAVRTGREDELRGGLDAIGVATWQPDAEHPYRLARLRVRTRLRLPDCCALEAAVSTGAALATFDEALAEAAQGLPIEVRS